jgi:hypothetical protein
MIATLAVVAVSANAPSAIAGTYPMYQCGGPTLSVAPGWSVAGVQTQASTVLSNDCGSGGAIGDYVFTNGQPGAVTENGSMGSQVVLAVTVPANFAGVTIKSLTGQVLASPVTGDDAYIGFSAAGQSLPGGAELPYGASSDYSTTESWTLPQGARDFQAFVNCTTDRSSPTCSFTDSTHVPALNNVVMTLNDSTAPTLSNVSGTLATAAGAAGTVSGAQTLAFNASDADSGVRSATLTLTPGAGGSPYTQTIDYSSQCTYSTWNACPLSESGSVFTVDTSTLSAASYAVDLSVSDAAGNVTNQPLGSIRPAGALSPLLGTASPWSVALKVTPRHVHRHTLVRLAGRVLSSPRPQRKLIYLQARTLGDGWRGHGRRRHRIAIHGPWITFQALQAKSTGSFSATYRFRLGGVHRYQMRAVAPAEAGYRNATGSSTAVLVSET